MNVECAIEWAYGEFRISRFRGNEVVASWKSPTPVNDINALAQAMTEAADIVELGRGGAVAIAYEDDLHTHEFLELPPMGRRDRTRYLQRYVDANKPFDGAAAWRAHPVERNKVNGVLLHLMPRYVLDGLMRVCAEFYLVPKLLVPLSEVMSRYVTSLERDEETALLLIALFDNRTQLLISDDQGEILFVRELSYSWTADTNGRLVVDINRTIGYAKQRIGGAIDEARVLGVEAQQVSDALNERIDATVRVDKSAAEDAFWMQQVAKLPASLYSNFVSILARGSVSIKTLSRAALLVTAVLVSASLVSTAMVETVILTSRPNVQSLHQRITATRARIATMQSEVESMDAEARKLDILNLDAFNLPGLFLSQLGSIMPEGLIATEVTVGRTGTGWHVAIQGQSAVSLGELAPLLATLQSNLSGSPWNGAIAQSWETVWMQQLEQGLAAGDGVTGFEVKGILR